MAQTLTVAAGQSVTDRARTWMKAFGEEMIRRRVYRTTLAELQSLSNRDLTDLGLARSELRRVAYEAAYRQ